MTNRHRGPTDHRKPDISLRLRDALSSSAGMLELLRLLGCAFERCGTPSDDSRRRLTNAKARRFSGGDINQTQRIQLAARATTTGKKGQPTALRCTELERRRKTRCSSRLRQALHAQSPTHALQVATLTLRIWRRKSWSSSSAHSDPPHATHRH